MSVLSLDRRRAVILAAIVLVALGLRLFGAYRGALMFDESAHLAAAETIGYTSGRLHLTPRSVDHPPMSVYLIRASGLVFGTSNGGLRVGHALIGAATVLVVFFLAARLFGPDAALWASALAAVDQFHLTWSYFMVPEVLLLFFAALSLLCLVRAVEHGSPREYLLYGLCLGLSYLAKETAAIFGILVALTTLLDGRVRQVWRSPWWYAAHVVTLATIAFDIWYNLAYFYEGYLFRDQTMASGMVVSPRALLLYVGELVERLVGGGVFVTDYATQNPALMHWPAGLLYLSAIGYAWWQRRRLSWVPFLIVLFLAQMVVFTFFTGAGSNGNYWWASMTLWPVLLLAAVWLSRMPRAVAVLFVAYLGARAVMTVQRPGVAVPRKSAAARVSETLVRAEAAHAGNRLPQIEWELVWTLHIAPPHPDLMGYLATMALQRGERERAAYFATRSLSLDPDQPLALHVTQALER